MEERPRGGMDLYVGMSSAIRIAEMGERLKDAKIYLLGGRQPR